jgi:hypothetical protein
MSEHMQRFGALLGACLCAFVVTLFVPASQADAIVILESYSQQDLSVNVARNFPCKEGEMVKVSGNVHVEATSNVTTSSGKVDIKASWGAMAAQNLTTGATYTLSSGPSTATLTFDPNSANTTGKVTVSAAFTSSNGESMTVLLDLDVKVNPTSGATYVTIYDIRLMCGSQQLN